MSNFQMYQKIFVLHNNNSNNCDKIICVSLKYVFKVPNVELLFGLYYKDTNNRG